MRRRWLKARNSTAGADYEPKLGPPILQALGVSRAVPEHVLRAWWRGLCEARWTESVAWREAAIAWHPNAPDARQFWEAECSPRKILQGRMVPTLHRKGDQPYELVHRNHRQRPTGAAWGSMSICRKMCGKRPGTKHTFLPW
jgi:hypothetical protein